jgi:hypothetical protein
MGKCLVIGTIRIPAIVGQAVLINGKKCDEETIWNINAYGGESHVTDFTVECKANVDFDIEADFSQPTDDYTLTILDESENPITFPFNISKGIYNWKLKLTLDKYITEDTYEILVKFDFTD